MEISQIYKVIDVIIKSLKEKRKNKDFLGLLLDAEALLEYLPGLINHSVEQEAEYRKFEARLSDEVEENGKRKSSAYCDTMAKASDFYREWQRAKQFIDLTYELVNISKKLASSVSSEFNSS